MPQVQLPIFPEGTTLITSELAFQRKDDQIVYLNGHLPVFTHQAGDLATFRFFTSQLIINGTASQGQIAKAFGVPLVTIKRCVKSYRLHGAKAFYGPKPKRAGHKLTPEMLAEAQGMLDEGLEVPEISEKTGVLKTTLHKAIDAGRLRQIKKKAPARAARENPSRAPKANAALSMSKLP
jgi:hypothetical protein